MRVRYDMLLRYYMPYAMLSLMPWRARIRARHAICCCDATLLLCYLPAVAAQTHPYRYRHGRFI